MWFRLRSVSFGLSVKRKIWRVCFAFVSNYQQLFFTCNKSTFQIVDIFIPATALIAKYWRTFCGSRVVATHAATHAPQRVGHLTTTPPAYCNNRQKTGKTGNEEYTKYEPQNHSTHTTHIMSIKSISLINGSDKKTSNKPAIATNRQ